MRRMSTRKFAKSSTLGDSADGISNNTAELGLLSQFGSRISIVWSFAVAFSNFYIMFTVFLNAGDTGPSGGVRSVLDISVEFILFMEVILRIIIKRFFTKIYQNLTLVHTKPRDSYFLSTLR